MNPRVEQAPFDSKALSRPLPDDAPIFCPICGRGLTYSYWDNSDNTRRYSSFVCYNGSGWAWLWEKIKTTYADRAHYRYDFGPTPTPTEPYRFDPLTGKRKP